MNNSAKLLSLIVVTGIAGLASFGLANTELVARLPFETLLAATASLGLVRFAFSDYSRRVKPLSVPAILLRPAPHRAARVAACAGRVAA